MRRAHLLRSNGLLGTLLAVVIAPLLAQSKADSANEFQRLLERGFALHESADYQHSLPVLRSAWKLRPHDYFANLLLGIDLLRTGKAEDAIGYLEEAARLRPQEDFPYDYMGEAQAARGLYAEAAEAHARAMILAPTSTQAVESAVDFWVERFREISATLRSTKTGLAAEYRLQAMSSGAASEKRKELLEHAASLDPKAPGVWSDLALADLATADPAGARANSDRALQEDSEDLGARRVKALVAAHDGDWQAAIAHLNLIGARSASALQQTLSNWPPALQPPPGILVPGMANMFLKCAAREQWNCPELAAGGAKASAEQSAKESAKRSAEKSADMSVGKLFHEQRWEAVAAEPAPRAADAAAWFERGVAMERLKQCGTAIPALERALEHRKGASFPQERVEYSQFLLSWCYAREAGRVVETVSYENRGALGHLVRGEVLLRMQGNSAAAVEEYSAALNEHKEDPRVLERLADAQFENGNFEAATAAARAALRLDPLRFSAMKTLANVAVEQRNYAEALPYLETLAQHGRDDPRGQVDLGVVLAETGNPERALQYLEPPLARGYADEKGTLHALLGSLLRKANRPEEATRAFAEARHLSDEYQRSSHRGKDE